MRGSVAVLACPALFIAAPVNGREGQYRVRMMDNLKGADCTYPAQHVLPDGTIFAATYGQWAKGKKNSILGYRFKVAHLDAPAKLAGVEE